MLTTFYEYRYEFLLKFIFPILFSFLAIILELSFAKISFLQETPPAFFLMFIFFWLFFLNIHLSYALVFFLGIIWDFLIGSIPGLMSTSLLLGIGILRLVNAKYFCTNFARTWLSFLGFISVIYFSQLLLFLANFWIVPSYGKLIFQLGLSMLIFPIMVLTFNPIKVLWGYEIEKRI